MSSSKYASNKSPFPKADYHNPKNDTSLTRAYQDRKVQEFNIKDKYDNYRQTVNYNEKLDSNLNGKKNNLTMGYSTKNNVLDSRSPLNFDSKSQISLGKTNSNLNASNYKSSYLTSPNSSNVASLLEKYKNLDTQTHNENRLKYEQMDRSFKEKEELKEYKARFEEKYSNLRKTPDDREKFISRETDSSLQAIKKEIEASMKQSRPETILKKYEFGVTTKNSDYGFKNERTYDVDSLPKKNDGGYKLNSNYNNDSSKSKDEILKRIDESREKQLKKTEDLMQKMDKPKKYDEYKPKIDNFIKADRTESSKYDFSKNPNDLPRYDSKQRLSDANGLNRTPDRKFLFI